VSGFVLKNALQEGSVKVLEVPEGYGKDFVDHMEMVEEEK
jgi:hypothetical protein